MSLKWSVLDEGRSTTFFLKVFCFDKRGGREFGQQKDLQFSKRKK